jgi:Flp pilus assembly protein CpaB
VTTTLTRRNGRAHTEPDGVPRRVERRVGLPSGRAVVGGLLMALATVGTFLAYADATADDTIEVLVAARDLTPGQTIGASDVELVPVELPDQVRGLFGAVDAAVGRQVAAPVEAGEFLLASATVMPVEGAEALEVAVSVPASRAVGRLRPGERVDVFSTWSGEVTQLVAVDARVLEVSGGSREGLGGSDTVVVRMALADFAQVEALVHAQAAGDITMVRATIGTEVEDVGREYRPRAAAARSAGSETDEDDG